MTVKSERQGGTEWVTGDVLEAVDLNDTFNTTLIRVGEDLTEGSHTGNTNETEIAEVLISANTAKTGIIIMASGSSVLKEGTCTIKFRSGTSDTATSNTERTSITNVTAGEDITAGWAINWVLTTEETWTGNVYIHITGTNSDALNNIICNNLVVIGW